MQRLLVALVLPNVTKWIAAQERRILAEGVPLSEQELADARLIGVIQPKRIRLLPVPFVPLPLYPLARTIGPWFNMPGDQTTALTARYGIFVRESHWGNRALIAHELVHTRQYERLGGIREFLKEYLSQCVRDGYSSALMEHEARDLALAVRAIEPEPPHPS